MESVPLALITLAPVRSTELLAVTSTAPSLTTPPNSEVSELLSVMFDSESMLMLRPLKVAPSRFTPVVALAWISRLPCESVPCAVPPESTSESRRMSLAWMLAPVCRLIWF